MTGTQTGDLRMPTSQFWLPSYPETGDLRAPSLHPLFPHAWWLHVWPLYNWHTKSTHHTYHTLHWMLMRHVYPVTRNACIIARGRTYTKATVRFWFDTICTHVMTESLRKRGQCILIIRSLLDRPPRNISFASHLHSCWRIVCTYYCIVTRVWPVSFKTGRKKCFYAKKDWFHACFFEYFTSFEHRFCGPILCCLQNKYCLVQFIQHSIAYVYSCVMQNTKTVRETWHCRCDLVYLRSPSKLHSGICIIVIWLVRPVSESLFFGIKYSYRCRLYSPETVILYS